MASINIPQASFLSLPTKFRAYVGGFGSGKTFVGCLGQGQHFWEHPKINQGYFAPTYSQIRDIYFPTVEEALFELGLKVKIKESNKEVEVFSGRKFRGLVKCRSMDKPNTIVGFKIGHALVDELDILDTKKAQNAWRKIIARMRYKDESLKNGVDVTTTPEGFKFVYQQFKKAVQDDPSKARFYGMIQASTYDNEANLPGDYIDSLFDTYPEQLIAAYLDGQFVNLTAGTIYKNFDAKLNNCHDTVQEGEPVFVGMDFNVGHMAGIIHVKRQGEPRAVDEVIDAYDTPDIIRVLKERLWRFEGGEYVKNREIHIYPDASGGSRKSNCASETDIHQLQSAGFRVHAPAANPPVKDRINAMNAAFCNGKGERRYLVNVARCPTYTESLEQQTWNEQGEPDKKSGKDHPNDAGGYFIHFDYPIIKPATRINIGMAM